MMGQVADRAVIDALQEKILSLQGVKKEAEASSLSLGLGPCESAFPGRVFPRAAVHELVSDSPGNAACTNGFLSVVLGKLIRAGGTVLWISTNRTLFPAGMKFFGVDPHRVVFVDTPGLKDALWAIEEALKCNALSAVVGEISELGFNESRRLQLAAERSRVTAFIHRQQPKQINAVACVSRWRITSVESVVPGNMPGVGFPRWNVQLNKVRNGRTGEWIIEWNQNELRYVGRKSGLNLLLTGS
jgi:protein ImuA